MTPIRLSICAFLLSSLPSFAAPVAPPANAWQPTHPVELVQAKPLPKEVQEELESEYNVLDDLLFDRNDILDKLGIDGGDITTALLEAQVYAALRIATDSATRRDISDAARKELLKVTDETYTKAVAALRAHLIRAGQKRGIDPEDLARCVRAYLLNSLLINETLQGIERLRGR